MAHARVPHADGGRTRRAVRVPVLLVLVLLAHVLTTGAAPAAGTPRTSTATASTASTSTVLDPGLPSTGPVQRVIVTGASAAAAVRAAGGRVLADLPLVEGVSAAVPAGRLAALAATSTITGVTADRSGSVVDIEWDVTASASTFARTVGATPSWARGTYGSGVGVAVLDTGVSPSPDLAGRIVHGPDLSGEGTVVDSHGHGTVMAGIIAGDGAASATRPGGAYTGMAPAAHVVAVKVAGRNGVVDVSTVLQAMHWVSVYRQQYGIRVLNLSWGVASTQSPAVDPLDHAVQRLWAEGIVVVVAAGNSGNGPGTITKPGDDPVVLTVGAMNDGGDLDPSNDDVPAWSSRGPTAAGAAKPDLVTPGRSLVAQRSRGSQVEADNPKALVSGDYVRGSGTSQAAAVASGAVALLLSRRPGLTPDQVKSVLMSTADPIAGTSRSAQGAGRMDLEAAMTATPSATPQVLAATGTGLIDASRGPARVTASCDGVPREIRGEIDVRCRPWDGPRWAGSSWTGSSWTGSSWTGSSWTGSSWTGSSWTDATWTGSSWTGGTWTGSSWQGSRGWTGEAAVTSAWTGSSWSGSSWTGSSWTSSAGKGGSTATGGADDDLLTAFWGTTPRPGKKIRGEAFTPADGS